MSVATDRLWSWLTVAAFVAGLAILSYNWLAPRPKPSSSAKAHGERLAKLFESVSEAEARLASLEGTRDRTLFKGSAESVGATLLANVTLATQASGVKLIAFRPQRRDDDGHLQRLPYMVLVEGSYPDVLKFCSEMETSGGKVAINMVQMSSSDGSSDKVSASFTVVAFTGSAKESKNGKA